MVKGGRMKYLKQLDRSKLYYLASPYSHHNSLVRQIRYESIIYAASELTKDGFRLIEPIGMCHQQSIQHKMPAGYEFWKTRDRGFIDICDAVILVAMKGWDESVGVLDEMEYAKSQGKEVIFLNCDDIFPEDAMRWTI